MAWRQLILLGLPVLIGVALWGTYATYFRDKQLVRGEGESSRAVVGSASELFTWAIGRENRLQIRRGVAHMMKAARNLLAFQTILEIDRGATYAGCWWWRRGCICTLNLIQGAPKGCQ